MASLSNNNEIIIDSIAKFYILTGVYPTVGQLSKITRLSKYVVVENLSELIKCGYFELDNEEQKCNNCMKRIVQ